MQHITWPVALQAVKFSLSSALIKDREDDNCAADGLGVDVSSALLFFKCSSPCDEDEVVLVVVVVFNADCGKQDDFCRRNPNNFLL